MDSQRKKLLCYFVFLVVNITAAVCDNADLFQLCLDCLKNVTANRCNFPFYQSNSSCDNKIDLNESSEEIPEPSLVCRDEDSITFSWNPTDEMYYFIQYFSRDSSESKYTDFTRCNHLTVNGLNANEIYTINLFGFLLGQGHVYRSRKIIKSTSKITRKMTPVKNLNYTLSLTENSYTATVKWKPGSDLSCLFEVLWYTNRELGEYIHRKVNLKKNPQTKYNLTNLVFGAKYHFSIISVNKDGRFESSKKGLKIPIPSCSDTFKSLTVCRPNTPRNLTITNISSTKQTDNKSNQTILQLNWNLPKLKPNFYIITFFSSNGTSLDGYTLSVNISGDQHSAIIENVELGKYYQIKLIAYSERGASVPTYIINYPHDKVDNSTTNSFVMNESTVITYQASKFILWIWIGTIFLIILIVLFIFRHEFKNVLFNWLFFKEKIDDTLMRYTTSETENSKWELAESKLLIDKVIGFGAFGIVQKGFYFMEPNQKTEVAVKTLKAKPTAEQIAQFYDEIEIMKSVPRHAHIVYLIGVVTKQRSSNPLMLVEYCARGDLQSFLRKMTFVLADSNTSSDENHALEYPEDGTKFFNKSYDMDTSTRVANGYVLESKDLLSFARQIVLGMEFLSNLRVIHRDLAARNVLITENNTLKISDFGLSRDIYIDNIYKKITGGKLPFRWMALESLTHQVYTTESDVWSFGIVLWEIVTLGENPYPTVNTENLIPLLKSGYRMDKPDNCSEELYQIMLNCWQMSPNLRASFRELREKFDKILEFEMQYISLEDSRKIDQSLYENTKTESEDDFSKRFVVHSISIS